MAEITTLANEDYLLNIALCGTAIHVEDVVRGYRRVLKTAPDRLPIPEGVPAGAFSESEELHRSRKRRVEALKHDHPGRCELEQGPAIAAATAVTRWRGESLDLGLAIDGLMQGRRSERGVPAETPVPD